VGGARQPHRARSGTPGLAGDPASRRCRSAQRTRMNVGADHEFAGAATKREFMGSLNPLAALRADHEHRRPGNDEHVRGRDMWVEIDHPQRGKWYNVGMPIKLSDSPARIERSPLLGEHTDGVLKESRLRRREESPA